MANSRSQRVHTTLLVLIGLWPLLTSCASTSTLHAAAVPPHSLRLAEVVQFAARSEIVGHAAAHQSLLASGIKDSDIRDGSVARGRVYCCGGKTEQAFAFLFYVPPDVSVRRGDFVEVKSGPVVKEGEVGKPVNVNVVTRVVDKTACRWDPPDTARHLTSVIYCDWMEKEGWTRHKGGLTGADVWIKQP